jgi:plasmid stabilization system protein ParE
MTGNAVEYHQGAISDVKSAVTWYHQRSRKAALDFVEELHRATHTIREGPDRWPAGKNGTRRFVMWRFPFSIIYSERESVITVWAVAHGSRLPEYWTNRL